MRQRTIVLSVNASWNVINFRQGLIRALQQEGHRVVALTPRDSWTDHFPQIGVEHFPLAMDRKSLSPWSDLALFWGYRRALRRIGADVFLGFTVKPNVWGSLAAHSLGIRVINNVSGLGTAFIGEGLLTRLVSALYAMAFRRSATIFFQNEEDRDLFLRKRIVAPQKARLLPGSGIDAERFRPVEPTGVSETGFTFLLIARLLRDKGVREYVEAARLVRREAPEARFQLLGFIDPGNRTAIAREEVDSWVDEGVVEYLGQSDDVRPAIAEAGCIVLPSYREGLPRTLLEAAAMAKPVIATDVPGCRQIVADGINGLLCRARDARSLADAMLNMLGAAPEQRALWGRAGRRRIEQEFDEKIVARLYLDAMAEALP
jgi:glycosyltransferase involved in cell wall biosynthesis